MNNRAALAVCGEKLAGVVAKRTLVGPQPSHSKTGEQLKAFHRGRLRLEHMGSRVTASGTTFASVHCDAPMTAGLGSPPRFLAFNEREQIGVHLILERRAQTVRGALVDLQARALNE